MVFFFDGLEDFIIASPSRKALDVAQGLRISPSGGA
jgi:hypothetical protein